MPSNPTTPDEILKSVEELRAQGKVAWKDYFTAANKIDHATALPLIQAVQNRAGKSIDQLGKDMETLVHYLLSNCGIFNSVKNTYQNNVHQLDHWGELSPLVMEYLSGKDIDKLNFVGESKNYSTKLNVDKIYKLESIKHFTHSKLGAFFTTFGLKGDFESSAKALLSFYYHKLGNVSLVFTNDDWAFLANDATKFPALFYEKVSQFQATYDTEGINYTSV